MPWIHWFSRPRALMLAVFRRNQALQGISEKFWRDCGDSFLASGDYYEKRAAVLQGVLCGIRRADRALDVGCGDGQFTELIAHHANSIDAFDLSPNLVQKARLRSTLKPPKARVEVADLESMPTKGKYDIVSCMGVLSCITADDKFRRVIGILTSLVSRDGFLLLVDTLGQRKALTRAHKNGYVAHYREQNSYLEEFIRHGMSLRQAIPIATMSRETVNTLYLFSWSPCIDTDKP